MNSNILIVVVVVQFVLSNALFNSQAAALDYDKDTAQLGDMECELSQDYLNPCDALREKDNWFSLHRDQRRTLTKLQESDMLQELLTPKVIRQKSIQTMGKVGRSQGIRHKNQMKEAVILEELLVETSSP